MVLRLHLLEFIVLDLMFLLPCLVPSARYVELKYLIELYIS